MNTTLKLNETNFDQEVLASPLPVIVDFYADWCGPCKMIAPVLEEIAAEQSGKVVVAKVNVDEQPALAQRFNVQALPTLLYFARGQVAGQQVGAASKRAILAKVPAAQAMAN